MCIKDALLCVFLFLRPLIFVFIGVLRIYIYIYTQIYTYTEDAHFYSFLICIKGGQTLISWLAFGEREALKRPEETDA